MPSQTEAVPDKSNSFVPSERLVLEIPQGLFNPLAIVSLLVWYVSSGVALFSNKYILSHLHGDPISLGTNQLVISVISGYIQIHILSRCSATPRRTPPVVHHFYRDIILIGGCRSVTVILGLIALKYAAVSFVATIKSSSPLFTVIISRILLGERTNYWTKLSMVQITLGLCLCSLFESSFDKFGLLCALGTNVFECLQNVYSKILISGDNYRYTAIELQFWASLIACAFQLPLLYYSVDIPLAFNHTSRTLVLLYILNGFAYHIQSVAAYAIMAYISPITHSVANTVKRALLIWLSVLVFHNPVTFFSGLGTLIVIFGVILYNEAQDADKRTRIFNFEHMGMLPWRDV